MQKKIFSFFILTAFLFGGQSINSFFLSDIKIENAPYTSNINKILLKYKSNNRTLDDIKLMIKELKLEYKSMGYTLIDIKLKKQTIKDGVLHLKVNIAKIGNVSVKGEKHYSQEFITNSFTQKNGDLLNYQKMIKSLLLLNDYSDLKVNALLKKSFQKNSTDITLYM